MAACAITISGDTGSVLIKYTLVTGNHSMTGIVGDTLYIDDSAENVTYSTTEGNAIAESECVDITSLPVLHYLFQWETLGATNDKANGMVFDAIGEGEAIMYFDSVDYTKNNGWAYLAQNIADEGNENYVPRSGKQTLTNRSSAVESIIITVIGNDIPQLRLSNSYSELYMYVRGTAVEDPVPSGYTEFNYVAIDD